MEGDSPLEKKPPRRLPDMRICRAKPRTPELVDCLVDNPGLCPHVLSFGDSYFCKHPKRDEIIARTVAAKQRKSG
jgi:hypothetical protein